MMAVPAHDEYARRKSTAARIGQFDDEVSDSEYSDSAASSAPKSEYSFDDEVSAASSAPKTHSLPTVMTLKWQQLNDIY